MHISSSHCINTGVLSRSKERVSEPIATAGSQRRENVLRTLSESPKQTGGGVCQLSLDAKPELTHSAGSGSASEVSSPESGSSWRRPGEWDN